MKSHKICQICNQIWHRFDRISIDWWQLHIYRFFFSFDKNLWVNDMYSIRVRGKTWQSRQRVMTTTSPVDVNRHRMVNFKWWCVDSINSICKHKYFVGSHSKSVVSRVLIECFHQTHSHSLALTHTHAILFLR